MLFACGLSGGVVCRNHWHSRLRGTRSTEDNMWQTSVVKMAKKAGESLGDGGRR